jgi:hypothetical protein
MDCSSVTSLSHRATIAALQEDGVVPLACRVVRKNSDVRTVAYADDEAFLSNFSAYTAHFSLRIRLIAAITDACAPAGRFGWRATQLSREFPAAKTAPNVSIVSRNSFARA